MANVVCEVDDLNEIDLSAIHKELEYVIFKDEAGKERKFKLKGMLSQSTTYFKKILPDIDWDINNIHVTLVVGDEIKQ